MQRKNIPKYIVIAAMFSLLIPTPSRRSTPSLESLASQAVTIARGEDRIWQEKEKENFLYFLGLNSENYPGEVYLVPNKRVFNLVTYKTRKSPTQITPKQIKEYILSNTQ